MSKGAGRIERAIAAAFTAEPYRIFTIRDLARIAYRGVITPKVKHTNVVGLAARRVAKRLHWRLWYGELPASAPDPLGWDNRGAAIRFVCKLDEAHYLRCCGRYPEVARGDAHPHSIAIAYQHKLFNRHRRLESQIARLTVAGDLTQAAELQAQLDDEAGLYYSSMLGASDIAEAILAGDIEQVRAAKERGDKRFEYGEHKPLHKFSRFFANV
jgi:hypothetical protein